MLTTKYRTLPRAYDLQRIDAYLEVLHRSPIPLIQIETRKLNSAVQSRRIPQEACESVVEWKRKHNLAIYDESEYRYLLRDLGLIADRPLQPEIDLVLPLGGDGPPVETFVLHESIKRMFYLTAIGEDCYEQLVSDHPIFENSLFWLILRNQVYLPLIQQLILNPKSYGTTNLAEVISTADSISKNCALHWLRYFSIITFVSTYNLQVENLARRLLAAAILEINNSFSSDEMYYVKEVDRRLKERFSLNSSAIDFCAALDIMFQHSKSSIRGYTSGRGDTSLPSSPNISMMKFIGEVPPSIALEASDGEILKILNYFKGGKHV